MICILPCYLTFFSNHSIDNRPFAQLTFFQFIPLEILIYSEERVSKNKVFLFLQIFPLANFYHVTNTDDQPVSSKLSPISRMHMTSVYDSIILSVTKMLNLTDTIIIIIYYLSIIIITYHCTPAFQLSF